MDNAANFECPNSQTMVVVLLLKIIFFSLSALSNIVLHIIFNVIAHLFVLVIQAFRVPGRAMEGALEQVRSLIGACLDYLLELVLEVIKSLCFAFLDHLKESISSSAVATGSAISNGLLEDFPELLEGLSDTIFTLLIDFWNSYIEAT